MSETYETFKKVKTVESINNKEIQSYYENFLIPNVSFWDMNKSSKSYAKETYFKNMVLAQNVTLKQNKVAYENSILKRIKVDFFRITEYKLRITKAQQNLNCIKTYFR